MKLSEIDETNITDDLIKRVLFNVPIFSYSKASTMVIFGCHIMQLLDERLNHALKVLGSKEIDNIIITGGVGEKGDFDESEYMLKFLEEHGVEKKIFIDNTSTNTTENVINIFDILRDNDMLDKAIVLVSNDFHLRKISMQLKKMKPDIDLIYEYPSVSLFGYTSLITNANLRKIAVDQVIKYKKLINDGVILDEGVDDFSSSKRDHCDKIIKK